MFRDIPQNNLFNLINLFFQKDRFIILEHMSTCGASYLDGLAFCVSKIEALMLMYCYRIYEIVIFSNKLSLQQQEKQQHD